MSNVELICEKSFSDVDNEILNSSCKKEKECSVFVFAFRKQYGY